MSRQQEEINQLLAGLNEKQLEAVTKQEGKYLVLAGSGSGKTFVLAKRVALLIKQGIPPWQIVAISFTKKAANELTERIVSMAGEKGLDVITGTFHSVCVRILLKHQAAIGMKNLTILDEKQASQSIEDIAMGYGYLKDGTDEIKGHISKWGSRGLTPEDLVNHTSIPKDFVSIFSDYAAYKRSVGYIDFDDILTLTHKLFNERPDILREYAEKYRYIHIDETQDNSQVQFKIMLQLSSYHQNYFIVGDDLQSVYKFRGADISNIMEIRKVDPDVETILLERNYRSSKNIVEASNGFISHNKNQLEKVAYTENPEGPPIFVYMADDELRESEYVVEMIEGIMKDTSQSYTYEDIAVLYRSNFLSQNIEFALSSAGIPYDVKNGQNFYEREEIKTLVSYLRVLDNPMDDLAAEYIINRPKRGIGDTTVNRMKLYAAGVKAPLSIIFGHVEDIPKINKPTKVKVKNFSEFLAKGRELLQTATEVGPILHYVMSETGIMTQYNPDKTADVNRIENIWELWNVAKKFDFKEKEPLEEGQTILTQFLTETALYAKAEDDDQRGKVTLSTIHGSKGLEYSCVFIIGLQDGIFPSGRSKISVPEYEEERRLMYVGMTRAKEILFLSHNKHRYVNGRTEPVRRSPFIEEIPSNYLKYIGIPPSMK